VEVKALGSKKGDDIRLSCCTRASGDVTIKTKP
jgi:ferredoxin